MRQTADCDDTSFQSSPSREAGRYSRRCGVLLRSPSFQSSPSREAGRYEAIADALAADAPVSILAQP